MTGTGPTMFVSFGFKHGLTIDGTPIRPWPPARRKEPVRPGIALVIDVRGWLPYNPHHNRAIRSLRGIDPVVQDEIRRLTPDLDAVLAELRDLVAGHRGPVYLGCTGGHHRSVFVADYLARAFGVPAVHKDIHTP